MNSNAIDIFSHKKSMPRTHVVEHWKSILLLSMPKSIGLFKTVGYDYNLKIIYDKGLTHEYKYNVNKDLTIDALSVNIFVNGRYNRTLTSLSSNEREDKLVTNFIAFLYSCHNTIDEWKCNYDIFTYNTYKLLRKFTCNIL